MSLRDQNDLQIVSQLKSLRSQGDLLFGSEGPVVMVTVPTEGQPDFDGSYEWTFEESEQWFRVEVATDSEFANIVQQEDVQAKQLLSTIADGTGYNIRVTALRVIGAVSPEVTGVSLNTTANEVPEGNVLVILGSVQGENNYNTSGTWTRESGDAIAFTVSGNEIDITGGTEGNSATFRFTADSDNSFFVERTVTVTASVSAGTDNSRAGDEESLRLHAESLGVANWYDNTGWSASSMSLDNTIYGVTVETIGGELRVTEIDLMANNLIGELPEFPGLQECHTMRFKQQEAGMNSDNPPTRITGRIPDSIGNNTKVDRLSLSGRKDGAGDPLDIFQFADDDPGDYNMKRGVAANQFNNGIPSSLYNLKLNRLEIDGQNPQFSATLQEACSNWDGMTHCYASGNDHYVSGNSAFVGAFPSGTKTWVNCVMFMFQKNPDITSYEDDMFEGWNNINRVIALGGGTLVSQPIPSTLEGLTKTEEFFLSDVKWTGEYPRFFNDYESISLIRFKGHRFTDSRDLNFQDSNIRQNFSLQLSDNEPDGLTGRFFTGPEKRRPMILFSLQGNEGLRDIITEGVDKWYQLRYYRATFTGGTTGSTLPSKPPGMYSCSLRFIFLSRAKMQGQLTSDWKYAGSFKDRGGVSNTGTITGFGTDGTTDHYIDDSNASYQVNELVDQVLHNVESNSGTKRRLIISNTATRIYYDGWTTDAERDLDLLEIGNSYEIERNFNTDNRAMTNGLSHTDNYLTGAVPTDIAPLFLVDNNFSLRLNLFQMKDIAPAVAPTEKKSRMNWLIVDPRASSISSASSGDVTFSFNGNDSVVTLDGNDTGNQQAQAIADAITADTGIELTCVFEEDGQTLVFDHSLTGITNALKDITYTDTDGTGFTFQSTGYNFIYAPQGRINSVDGEVRRYSVPDGYTVPTFFQNDTRTITVGTNPTIDFSDQAYAGNVYQWRRKLIGESVYSDISGATTDTLTITDFQSADRGDYILEITNPAAPDFTGDDIMRSGTITLTT